MDGRQLQDVVEVVDYARDVGEVLTHAQAELDRVRAQLGRVAAGTGGTEEPTRMEAPRGDIVVSWPCESIQLHVGLDPEVAIVHSLPDALRHRLFIEVVQVRRRALRAFTAAPAADPTIEAARRQLMELSLWRRTAVPRLRFDPPLTAARAAAARVDVAPTTPVQRQRLARGASIMTKALHQAAGVDPEREATAKSMTPEELVLGALRANGPSTEARLRAITRRAAPVVSEALRNLEEAKAVTRRAVYCAVRGGGRRPVMGWVALEG